jgi:hypothetical protein
MNCSLISSIIFSFSFPHLKKKIKKKKEKKKMGFQRIEPMSFCIRAQAAIVALISHFKILTNEELQEVYIGFLTKRLIQICVM